MIGMSTDQVVEVDAQVTRAKSAYFPTLSVQATDTRQAASRSAGKGQLAFPGTLVRASYAMNASVGRRGENGRSLP